jgi:antitoxin CcdA
MPRTHKKPAPKPQATPRAPKRKGVNLTIREDVLAEAKALNLNASQAAEAGIREAVRKAREAEWLREARPAIDAYNERIARDGPLLVSDWARPFWDKPK